MKQLSILIPTLEKRRIKYGMLMADLERQISEFRLHQKVEIITNKDEGKKSIGQKRNELVAQVQTPYFCFIDDDDRVQYNYIPIILDRLKSEPDCVELQGIITTNKEDPRKFIHSVKYVHYFEQNHTYYRPPNHLNTIRTDLVKDIKFPLQNFSEDTSWAMEIVRLKRLKTMEPVPEPIYYYDYITNK